MKKKILLFSTLNPYPYWAGSENLWFDFVSDERARALFEFHLSLADSQATRKKAAALLAAGAAADVRFYKHFNSSFGPRNLYRLIDRVGRRPHRTLPWYDRIEREHFDLVWFNVAELGDLADLHYAVELCRKKRVPYWLLLQHGFENFFLTSEKEIETVTRVSSGATRFVFISKRNRRSLERAVGRRLENALHSVNALPAPKIEEARRVAENAPVGASGTARFFNLGRFSPPDKAQHVLLESFADRKWRARDWRLSFIGVADFGRFYLERLIDFYGLQKEKIRIEAHTERVFEAIAGQDVLLMPSRAEGTPFAMIESMACGRPALGTPIGGIPELIVENRTGWLARTVDARDVAEKLETVWQERGKWLEFGENARKHVAAEYSEEKSFAELTALMAADAGARL